MNSQPLPTPTESTPTPAPRPAARARALRRRRHPRLRPTGDPKTLWRSRDTAWTTLSQTALEASLPHVATAPLTNVGGEKHPFEYLVALDWPASGALSNAERRAWNLWPVTTTDNEKLIDPQELAVAFRRTLKESTLGTPEHWDAGATKLGEWWALRARYPSPESCRSSRGPVETALTLRHAVGSPAVHVQAGLRLPETGAEIITAMYYAVVDDGRIRLRNGAYDLMTTLAHHAQATAILISSWTEEALLRPALASWANRVARPKFGHSAAARLMAMHDSRRFSNTEPAESGAAPMDTAHDVAWTLADDLRSVADIETRTQAQNLIIRTVSELCWWNENDEQAFTASESVH